MSKKWNVRLTKTAELQLEEHLKKGVISKADIKVLLRWVDEMEEFGPDHIALSKEWHDHELKRNWNGYRSSAFSKAGRVIYKVVGTKVVVEVHRVTATHNYKK